jgi:hypothetical protein
VRPFDGLLADLARAIDVAHARQRKASGETA